MKSRVSVKSFCADSADWEVSSISRIPVSTVKLRLDRGLLDYPSAQALINMSVSESSGRMYERVDEKGTYRQPDFTQE
jgi:hypothetical protein